MPFQAGEQSDMQVLMFSAEIVNERMEKDLLCKLLSAHMFNMLFRKDPLCFAQAVFFVHQILANFQRIGFDRWPYVHVLIVTEYRSFAGTDF